ncbi:DNA-binding protein [Pseudomonas sp. GCM10022188]|uniref:DNA-binding protein n=1 Tax=Pseudomonas TaxID=286 RepID=UPI001E493C2F|nr:DNA-binding protein [Pseudomonas oryzagri]MCC6076567.1 DNA-binding protein [Pseudomonas oryzagri]
MARGGINKALVMKARKAVLARGEHPSIDAIRIELGNTGSKSTIHRYLREIEQSGLESNLKQEVSLSQEIAELVTEVAERLQQEAHAAVAADREALAQERAGYLQRLQQAEARIRELEGDCASLTAQLQATAEAYRLEQEQLQQARIEGARLQQAEIALAARVADRDAQLLSLEDKHRHAREALEHYRQASKEQREQDQRRHEAQIQQLQMEGRQLQQSLIVKQDELTRLNRDNERFVTESRQLRKDMAGQQEALERREQELQQREQELATLAARLAQSEAGRELLQARSVDAQAEVARLGEALAAQGRQVESLRAGLSEMAARFSELRLAQPAHAAEQNGAPPAEGPEPATTADEAANEDAR